MPRTLNLQTACPLSGKIMSSFLMDDVTIVAIGFYVDMLRSSHCRKFLKLCLLLKTIYSSNTKCLFRLLLHILALSFLP